MTTKRKHKTHEQRRKEQAKKGMLQGEVLSRLEDLFRQKHWEINHTDLSCYMRYVRTLSKLKPEEQNFLMTITRRFEHIPLGDYVQHLAKPLGQMRKQFAGKLVFVGCMTEEDIKHREVKSCKNVLYQLKGTTMRYYINLWPKVDRENVRAIKARDVDQINAGTAMLVFVDDYIGTGETALAAANYLAKAQPRLTNWGNVSFLAIAAQKEGMEKLAAKGYRVYVAEEYGKGISDYYKGKKLDAAREMMTQIESGLKGLDDKFRFGYNQSEGLVCMERCPINTFPIYWLTKHDAPYERGK